MEENVKINKVSRQVFPLLGDSKEIIQTQLQGVADRVLMPLPEKALEYLPYALSALKTIRWLDSLLRFSTCTRKRRSSRENQVESC